MTKLNYYEQQPQNNTFNEIVVDVTHRCNMSCNNCYIPNRSIPDLDYDKIINLFEQVPKKVFARIIGAEPTLRKDLPQLCKTIKKMGHRVGVATNGLKISNKNYLKNLRKNSLYNIHLSLNGIDNDDWYEQIDNMRCSEKKIKALDNLNELKYILDIGTVIVKGINDDAPKRMINFLNEKNIKNVIWRIKNVGQIGNFMRESENNYSMDGLISLVSNQLNIPIEKINRFRNKLLYKNTEPESTTFMFPLDDLDVNVSPHKNGRWIRIVNWDAGNEYGIPAPNRTRVGRVTPDFKIAPFYEHVKENEFGF